MAPYLVELCVLALGLLLLLLESFFKEESRNIIAGIALVGLAFVFFMLQWLPFGPSDLAAYAVDPAALFFKKFSVLTTIVVIVMARDYSQTLRRYIYGLSSQSGVGEYFAIPVLTCAGLMWMSSAVDFILIFVSLELVTISFYILVAYLRRNSSSLEAGVKYLILSALSTGFLVYGITWIYGVTGNTNLLAIQKAVATLAPSNQPGLLFGAMLVLVGLGFKIAAVPFQFWVADVYQGAPTPTTAFLSVGSKAVGFIVLLRFVQALQTGGANYVGSRVIFVLVLLAAATLIYGNLAALPQTNFKRLLAYSSIGHAGYLLMAVASVGAGDAGRAVVVYFAAYLLMTLLSFHILIVVSQQSEGEEIAHFNGLSRRSPFLAFGLLVAMMSLAGVPLTAGFFGKFMVFKVAAETHQFLLLALGIITVGCGFYYYLKVVRAMYWQPSPARANGTVEVSRMAAVTISVLVALIILLGVFPQIAFFLLGY